MSEPIITPREVLEAMPLGIEMTAREIAKLVLGPNAKGHWISGTLMPLQGEFLDTKPSTYAGSKKYRKIADLPPPKVEADPNLVQVEAGGAKVTMPRLPDWARM